MHIALVLIWGFIFAISTSAYGQENFTVSGEISFQEEKGQLCVWLRNQDEHDLYLDAIQPVPKIHCSHLKIGGTQYAANG